MCTNITIQRKSEASPLISARTMDFPETLITVVNFVPRGQTFPEIPVPEEIHWKNRYGYVGMAHPRNEYPMNYSDGLNEVGLSAAMLYLPNSIYPIPKPGTPILLNTSLVSYILGNFQNVKEVEAALSEFTVVDAAQYDPSAIAPVHFIVSDAFGYHLIIEFINGEMQTHINKMGVLTNEPQLEWHLNNLGNYENLSFHNNPNILWGSELYGSGQFGSPGDPTPQSRFVRAAFLRKSAFHPKDIQQSIGLAFQILETLAVPRGTILRSGTEIDSFTLWGVIRDHTNCSLYFYTDFNSRLYGIHLDKLNFNASNQKQIDIVQPDWYEDITGVFPC